MSKDPKDYAIEQESEADYRARVELGKQALARMDAARSKGVLAPGADLVMLDGNGQPLQSPEPVIEQQMQNEGWYGVDLDGTLAQYDHFRGSTHIGDPVPAMLEKVKEMLAEGKNVKIFTARVAPSTIVDHAKSQEEAEKEIHAVVTAIVQWCGRHIGRPLDITHSKDYKMIALYDDRCIQIVPNKGIRADGKPL